MAVSNSFRIFVVEQLSKAVPPVRARPMYGGVGLYSGDVFFALIDDDVVYLKADDSTRAEFEKRGLRQFNPFGEDGTAMHYYELPADALEDTESLAEWASSAIAVARRAKPGSRKRR
jgi:DNA transformation protein